MAGSGPPGSFQMLHGVLGNQANPGGLLPTRLTIYFAIVLEKFVDVFGEGSIRILPYSNIVDEGADTYAVFCKHLLGLDIAASKKRLDPSPGLEDLELLRVMNMMEARAGFRRL
jgi:hypothetical protein